jgi:hypothetical protein
MASDTYGTIYLPTRDYISFGINRDGEVITWLGDLAALPVSEQYYFRSENIDSSHDIASEFYDGQINIIFSEPSKEQKMFTARAEFTQHTNRLLGCDSTQLDVEAKTILEFFTPPLDEGRDTILDAFHDLHKICIETIYRKAFVQNLQRLKVTFDRKSGSLKILQFWGEHTLQHSNVSDIVSPLFVLDDLRKLEAHLIGSNSASEIMNSARVRLQLDHECELLNIYDKIIIELHQMYKTLTQMMRTQ